MQNKKDQVKDLSLSYGDVKWSVASFRSIRGGWRWED